MTDDGQRLLGLFGIVLSFYHSCGDLLLPIQNQQLNNVPATNAS